jgi:hypothetical protein
VKGDYGDNQAALPLIFITPLSEIGHRESGWCMSLMDSQTGERLGFTDLDAMVAFLQKQICESARGGGGDQENSDD